jgi:hypothetical protein
MIDKEAVLVLLKQILAARPQLKDTIRSSREFLFGVIARIYILDEMRREFAFEREEISVLFDSLLEPEFIHIPDKRLQRFFEQIMAASKEVVKEEAFRQAVAAALLEAVKNKGAY